MNGKLVNGIMASLLVAAVVGAWTAYGSFVKLNTKFDSVVPQIMKMVDDHESRLRAGGL